MGFCVCFFLKNKTTIGIYWEERPLKIKSPSSATILPHYPYLALSDNRVPQTWSIIIFPLFVGYLSVLHGSPPLTPPDSSSNPPLQPLKPLRRCRPHRSERWPSETPAGTRRAPGKARPAVAQRMPGRALRGFGASGLRGFILGPEKNGPKFILGPDHASLRFPRLHLTVENQPFLLNGYVSYNWPFSIAVKLQEAILKIDSESAVF